MKSTLAPILMLGMLLAACGGSDVKRKDQQKYDVVEEGSATGVSSTISGPGETQPPAVSTPLTATNADTTTNFTIPTATATTTMPPLTTTIPPAMTLASAVWVLSGVKSTLIGL